MNAFEKMLSGIKGTATPLQDLIMLETDVEYREKAAAELEAMRTMADDFKHQLAHYEVAVEELEAELKALKAERDEIIQFLRNAENDFYCDNDGRGCGTGCRAGELADKLEGKSINETPR